MTASCETGSCPDNKRQNRQKGSAACSGFFICDPSGANDQFTLHIRALIFIAAAQTHALKSEFFNYAIMTMVEAGLGVSIMAELILHRTNYRIALRPTAPSVTRTIAIGFRDKGSLPMASRRFIGLLQSHIDELP